MKSDHRIAAERAISAPVASAPIAPMTSALMTGADIDAFIARAKFERAAGMRDGMLKFGRRLRRLLSARRAGRASLLRNGIRSSHA
jgi:hypothetical protein